MGGCSCGGSALLYSSKNEEISIKKKGKKKKNDKETYRRAIMVDIWAVVVVVCYHSRPGIEILAIRRKKELKTLLEHQLRCHGGYVIVVAAC